MEQLILKSDFYFAVKKQYETTILIKSVINKCSK